MVFPRLTSAREAAGLSMRELSRLAGLGSATHVEGIEGGRIKNPSSATVAALARVLGCSVDWLLGGAGELPAEETIRAAVAAAREKGGVAA